MLVTGSQARAGVQNCMKFYSHRRPHKALGGRTPAVVNSLSSRNPNPIGRSRSELKRRRILSKEWGTPQLGVINTKHSVYKSRGTSVVRSSTSWLNPRRFMWSATSQTLTIGSWVKHWSAPSVWCDVNTASRASKNKAATFPPYLCFISALPFE